MASFDDLRGSFWRCSGDHDVPPLTEEAIVEAERLLAVTLPESLLDLLRAQNGGPVADHCDAFPTEVPTSWSDDHIPFESVLGIDHRDGAFSLLDSPYLVEEWGLPAELVLISGDGHFWIGLDYRSCGPRGEASVTWFDTDVGTEAALAPDFRAFVEGLRSADDFAE